MSFTPRTHKVVHQGTGGTATLPPAGHARKEVLKKRKDTLEHKAEEMAGQVEVGAIDPKSFEVSREIGGRFDELQVVGALPQYAYKWVQIDYPTNSRGKMARLETINGWEVVTGDMPEAPDLRQADGTRRLGDVILMRIRRDRFEKLQSEAEQRRVNVQRGVTSGLQEMGDRYRKHGVKIHTAENMPEHLKKAIEHPSPGAVNAMRGALAAQDQLDAGMRDGTLNLR